MPTELPHDTYTFVTRSYIDKKKVVSMTYAPTLVPMDLQVLLGALHPNIKIPSSRKSSREVSGRGKDMGGPDNSQGVLSLNWSGTEPNRNVTCMVFKATADDRRPLARLP
ncbi:hypothetical protein TNCV_4360721 [Trichonephila clavipes]|uniref:Uncharacterized protein n=1 Tax=Trichonephila clavipes TaxID=2585209 RepID=A0A8X6WAK3_TRICX|nr:hypothetical protein TNCV_4360721 [Trichonephila clavipes]